MTNEPRKKFGSYEKIHVRRKNQRMHAASMVKHVKSEAHLRPVYSCMSREFACRTHGFGAAFALSRSGGIGDDSVN
jgi:hypothetical protein